MATSIIMNEASKGAFACGNVPSSEVNVPANAYADFSINFGKTIDDPFIIVGFMSGSTAAAMGRLAVGVASQTTTGFVARVWNSDTSARSPGLRWLAMDGTKL